MTTTAHDIATIIQHDHDLSAAEAAGAVENWLTFIEGVDGREIDRDAIDRLDAGFVEIAIAVDEHKREVKAAEAK